MTETSDEELTFELQPVPHSFHYFYNRLDHQASSVADDTDVDDTEDLTDDNDREHENHVMVYYRLESGRVRIRRQIENISYILLGNGFLIRFRNHTGLKLLIPMWYESCMIIRKIVSLCISKKLIQRLRFMSNLMDEEEGYDSNGNMTYYHLRIQVMESYMVEMRLRAAMRRVLTKWRNYQMDKRSTTHDTIDPITLSEPDKPVVLYDWKSKRRFMFDAKSLAILIETHLSYHEYGFPIPQYPRNPWMNLDFTYRDLVSIYYQLKQHGELRWGLTTLRQHNFNKTLWFNYHRSALIMKAIEYDIKHLDTEYAVELLEEFICRKIEEVIPLSNTMIHAYKKAIRFLPDHWIIQRWKSLALAYYEMIQFGHLITMINTNELRSHLIQKQYLLFRDLYKLGHITQRMIPYPE